MLLLCLLSEHSVTGTTISLTSKKTLRFEDSRVTKVRATARLAKGPVIVGKGTH